MQEVDLPIVTISIELGAAIDLLRMAKRSALLAKQEKGYLLFSAGNVVVGRSKGAKALSDLTPSAVVSVPVPTKKQRRFALEVALPDFGGGAGKVLADYVLVKVSSGSAVLKFRDSVVAQKYVSAPKDYYCDGPPQHDDFPPPDVSEGDDCPHKDGYKVVSSK